MSHAYIYLFIYFYTQYLCSSGCMAIMFVFYKYPHAVCVMGVGMILSVEAVHLIHDLSVFLPL